jgi:RecG-like helicase
MLDLLSKVSKIPKIGPKYEFLLSKLGINTVKDLLFHIPSRYEDYSNLKKREFKLNQDLLFRYGVEQNKNTSFYCLLLERIIIRSIMETG